MPETKGYNPPPVDRVKRPTPSAPAPEWPPRFHCHVPGLFKSLAHEGYGLILAPLVGDLNAIIKRANELGDPKLLEILKRMGLPVESDDA